MGAVEPTHGHDAAVAGELAKVAGPATDQRPKKATALAVTAAMVTLAVTGARRTRGLKLENTWCPLLARLPERSGSFRKR